MGNINHKDTQTASETEGLKNAFEMLKRTPGEQDLHEAAQLAATDFENKKAVRYLQTLVHSDFAILNADERAENPASSLSQAGSPAEDAPTNASQDTEIPQQRTSTESDVNINRDLTKEEAVETLEHLFALFIMNKNLHPEIEWEGVNNSLVENPVALWSLSQMMNAGHEPSVYHEDENYYYFASCSAEAPESSLNCVFDEEAAAKLKAEHPEMKFAGSAVKMAKAMGVKLMTVDHYERFLQKKKQFEKERWIWLAQDENHTVTSPESAFFAFLKNNSVVIDEIPKTAKDDEGGWRGMLKVRKKK